MEWILVKTVFSLLAVLALMAGVVVVLKKYVYQSGPRSSSSVAIEVLGQRALHPKRSIVVVKVLRTVLVVGMSEQGLQTLATIDDEESLSTVDEKPDAEIPASRWMVWRAGEKRSSFAGQLQDSIRSLLVRRGENEDGPARIARKPRRRS